MGIGQEDLIDTQWNVNTVTMEDKLKSITDLIDTQWNVNQVLPLWLLLPICDLIDTQWNVNPGVSWQYASGQTI